MPDDLTRYRIDCKEPWHTDPEYADGGPPHYFECMVPDDTLQDIADAWKTYRSIPDEDGLARIGSVYYVKATRLLDGLVKDE